MDIGQVLASVLKRYEKRAPLTEGSRAAFLALPFTMKEYSRHAYLVREGDYAGTTKLIVKGTACRHKVTRGGARQIVSLHIRGDFVDLDGSLLLAADHNVQALEPCQVAEAPRDALIDLIEHHGGLAHSMWVDTLIDASIYREWVVNVGRRDARLAMCHLLCEFGRRLEVAGLGERNRFILPMTQEELSDCLGLTPVHVNRVLQKLRADGLLIRHQRHVEVPDSSKLSKTAGFSDLYLHLNLMA